MTMIDPERLSRQEADERGLDELLDDASDRPIAVETDHGDMILMRRAVVDEVVEVQEDLLDSFLVITRSLTDSGTHRPLADVIADLGLTREEIDAAED